VYEFVHTAPETRTTVRRFALTAERQGYDSLVVRNHYDPDAEIDESLPEVPDDTEIPVYEGVEIRADDAEELHHGMRKAERADVDAVVVHGGDEPLNRAAIEAGVDLLAHPNRASGRRNERSFDHVLAREAADTGVAVEFNLSSVLRSSGGERVKMLRRVREMLELVRKYDTPYVVSGDPSSHLDLRAQREVRALCELAGFEADEARAGIDDNPTGVLSDEEPDVRVVDE